MTTTTRPTRAGWSARVLPDTDRRLAPAGLALALLLTLALAPGCSSALKNRRAQAPPQTIQPAAGTQQGDSGVVRTEFRSEVAPKDQVGVHLDLARAHELRGDPQAAVYEYAQAIEAAEAAGRRQVTAEQQALAHRRMAAALDRLGRFAQAEAHYQSALELRPDDPKIWNDAGYSAYLRRNWAEAERRLEKAASLDPQDARARTNLGLCLAATGRTDEALAALSEVGGPAVGHANLAYILAATGRTVDARRHYEIALKFQPELQPARLALARLDAPAAGVASGAQIAANPAPATDPALVRTAAPGADPAPARQ